MYKPILATAAFVTGLASVGIVSTTEVQAETKQDEILVDQGPGLMPAKDVATFKDVTADMWAYEDIMYLSSESIIKGYGDGRYGPKDNVTRGQVAALIHRYLSTKGDVQVATKNPYQDIKGNMYADAILAVSNLGIMGGFPDGTFKPNGVLTRAEMASVMTTTFDLKTKNVTGYFSDMSNKHWANDAVRALYSNGLTFGDGNNNFNPEGKVTREQYASFLNRAIHLDQDFVPEPIPVKPVPKPDEPIPMPKPEPPIITPTPEPGNPPSFQPKPEDKPKPPIEQVTIPKGETKVPDKATPPSGWTEAILKQHQQTAIDTVFTYSPKRGKGQSFGISQFSTMILNSPQATTDFQIRLNDLNENISPNEKITITDLYDAMNYVISTGEIYVHPSYIYAVYPSYKNGVPFVHIAS